MSRVWRAFINGLKLRRRLLLAIAIAAVMLILLPASLQLSGRMATAWSAGGIIYLILTFAVMTAADASRIQSTARMADEARFVFFAVLLLAILSSFYAVFTLVGEARSLAGWDKSWRISLAAVTVVVSWLVMQVIFTLHYAHDFYGESDSGSPAGGMTFPGDEEPDYWDFFYFTTSIGAASQTSDVSITSKAVRRMVAFQAVLAFLFNTTVVALAINLASGLI